MDSDITEQMNGIRSTLELLEQREEELNANLANQSTFFTDLDRIKTYARDLKTYLREGNEDTLKLIFHLVVDKIIVRPGSATIRYTIPMPPDGTGDWMLSEELDLDGPVLRISPLAHAGVFLQPGQHVSRRRLNPWSGRDRGPDPAEAAFLQQLTPSCLSVKPALH